MHADAGTPCVWRRWASPGLVYTKIAAQSLREPFVTRALVTLWRPGETLLRGELRQVAADRRACARFTVYAGSECPAPADRAQNAPR
jgi:hypothetical protein